MNVKRKIRSFVKLIKEPDARFVWLARKGLYKNMPDDEYLKKMFPVRMGYDLDLEHPHTFNEKIQWLKLNNRDPRYVTMVDKCDVKKYVADVLGEQYVIRQLGVWKDFSEIDFDKLPNQFVLKCTHDSGGLVICKDKQKLDLEKARQKISSRMGRSYFSLGREWVYQGVAPRIIAEEYLTDESGEELKDYKVFCFNGEPRLIQLDYGRFQHHQRNMYSPEWELQDFHYVYQNTDPIMFPKPARLQEMLELAAKLSKGIPFVRTDFYILPDRVLFGEITFYPEAGFGKFYPEEWDYKLGDWLKLS